MATPTPLPGDFSPGQVLTAAEMDGLRGAFRILQVVSTTDTTSRTTTSTFPVVSGMSITITPQSTSSLIFITSTITFNATAGSNTNKIVLAGLSFGAGSTTPIFATRLSAAAISTDWFMTGAMNILHSPNTTSACVYNVLFGRYSAAFDNTVQINTLAIPTGNGSSTLTAFEVSA